MPGTVSESSRGHPTKHHMCLRGATRGRVRTSAQLVSAGRTITTMLVNACDAANVDARAGPGSKGTQVYKSRNKGEGASQWPITIWNV